MTTPTLEKTNRTVEFTKAEDFGLMPEHEDVCAGCRETFLCTGRHGVYGAATCDLCRVNAMAAKAARQRREEGR